MSEEIVLRGHPGIGPRVEGEALVSREGFSARYDLNRKTGVFSREASAFVDLNDCKYPGDWENARCDPERPSFNCIRLKPREEDGPDGVEMKLEVYEMDEEPDDTRPFHKTAHISPLVLSDDSR